MENTVTDVTPCHQEEKVIVRPPSNALSEPRSNEAHDDVAAVAKLETSSGDEHAAYHNRDPIDNDGGKASKPSSHIVDKSHDKTPEEKPKPCGSIIGDDAAPASPNLKHEPDSTPHPPHPSTTATATAAASSSPPKEASTNHTKEAEDILSSTPSPASSSSSPLSSNLVLTPDILLEIVNAAHHGSNPGDNATTTPNAATRPQVMIIDTSSPVVPTTNNNVTSTTTITNNSKKKVAPATAAISITNVVAANSDSKKMDSKKPSSDDTAGAGAGAGQEQSNKDGGSHSQKSSTQSKKKKKKNKKKKKKNSNPDNHPAKSTEPPDQNQKTADKEVVQDKRSDISGSAVLASAKKKGVSSDNVGAASAAAADRPSKAAKAASVAKGESFVSKNGNNKTNEKNDKSNGSADASSRISSTGATKKSETGKEKSDEAKKPDAKDKTKAKSALSSPSDPSSHPNKKNAAAAPENQSKADDADDGAWETVEVKTRGRRGKGGGKKSSSGASNNKTSNNKSSNNNNSNNNGGGRNHNNDHGGNHGNNQDGGGNTNHGGGRRRNRRHKGGDKQRNNQHQQTKLVKDVISHILDVVDEEVVRRRGKNGGGKQGSAAKSADEGKRGNGRAGNSEKGSTSNSKHHGQRKQSGGAVTNNPNPPPSIPCSKSLRDVLIGATPAAAPKLNLVKAQAKPPNNVSGETNGSDTKIKGGGSKSEQASKGSSKIKPGMSYKSVIDPAKPPAPETQKLQPAHKPKTKVNAWAKPPVNIKNELTLDIDKTINLEPKNSAAPLVQSVGSGVLVPLVPLVADNGGVPPSSADEVMAKNEAAIVGAPTVVERPAAEEVACQTSDNENDTTAEDVVPSPPLSTLLGPGNSCSASSSVASSLEAPHSSNRFGAHPSSSQAPEDDVGYHLLNVCGQLSEEINTFMSRRALALDVRRKEREAVMCAVGDTLGKIWPRLCQVEMYGSCATQLDLPSSDLDLVVCGLDDVANHPPPIGQHVTNNFDNPCNSFQEEEVPQECVDASIIQQPGQEQPMSPDRQQLAENSLSSSIHAGGENELVSTPDNQFVEGVVVEGDPGMIQDESADDMLTMDYSPGAGVETYSPEYHESNRQEGAGVAAMENYSPGYSYHSNKQEVVAAAENFSPVYAPEEMSMVEGYHGQEYQPNGQEFYYSPYDYVSSLSLNAQRVLRLASELELQPWAVQVKAIPTATVPVVKMLADPSRLPGLAGTPSEDWMMQQHIAAQAGVVAGTTPAPTISPEQISVQNQGSVSPSSHFLHPMAQWRGTDIKNGLQPVDITFEGLEHGGIGSTTYSLHVVDDASKETGLPPESTPVVQVTSVLKELLAQRRLNEPFSGGLSSYGLLMLLLAVVKDRKIIQEEMKKMERQRQKVSDPDNREARRKNNASMASSLGVEPSDKSSAAPSTTSKPAGSSSWASVAKKSNGSTARTESLSTVTNDSATTAKTGANYSQAIQKDIQETANIAGQGNDESSAKNYVSGPPNETERLSLEKKLILPQSSSNMALDCAAVLSQVTPSSEDDCKIGLSSIPQGNDVFEVLCSGELTSGKLLMHFLLFFGQHFDAQSTLIDILGTHHPDYGRIDRKRLSPFVTRPPGGAIDPITGMFSVDPIVVYDPLEGAADHNVSKRCYCWNNVRWVFAQCYMTVSSIVESSGTCAKNSSQSKHKRDVNNSSGVSGGDGKSGSIKPSEQAVSSPDVVTPILELLLSF